jgi:hypothetical protein
VIVILARGDYARWLEEEWPRSQEAGTALPAPNSAHGHQATSAKWSGAAPFRVVETGLTGWGGRIRTSALESEFAKTLSQGGRIEPLQSDLQHSGSQASVARRRTLYHEVAPTTSIEMRKFESRRPAGLHRVV